MQYIRKKWQMTHSQSSEAPWHRTLNCTQNFVFAQYCVIKSCSVVQWCLQGDVQNNAYKIIYLIALFCSDVNNSTYPDLVGSWNWRGSGFFKWSRHIQIWPFWSQNLQYLNSDHKPLLIIVVLITYMYLQSSAKYLYKFCCSPFLILLTYFSVFRK
jgi:hypothetical protein